MTRKKKVERAPSPTNRFDIPPSLSMSSFTTSRQSGFCCCGGRLLSLSLLSPLSGRGVRAEVLVKIRSAGCNTIYIYTERRTTRRNRDTMGRTNVRERSRVNTSVLPPNAQQENTHRTGNACHSPCKCRNKETNRSDTHLYRQCTTLCDAFIPEMNQKARQSVKG